MKTAYHHKQRDRHGTGKPFRQPKPNNKRLRRKRRRHLVTIGLLLILLLCCAMAFSQKNKDSNQIKEKKYATEIQHKTTKEQQPAPPSYEAWNLRLVNPWNTLPSDYTVALTQMRSGHSIDERAYPQLQQMMDDCRAGGLNPLICSSYRTREKQETLFNNQVNALIAQGYSQVDAKTEAGKSVAVPGTSEHELGLALDIVDTDNQNLDQSQEDTPVQKWLMENSWRYGFILRYPNGKSEITGIIYEPWHYRYVGKDAAREIFESGLCLEEYLEV